MSAANTYEKLGAFYLGRTFNARQGEVTDELLLYDAKDLTTHAVCVGMTGSGKTGLGVTLLEEAAIDGIPAIIIDPKGDMGNLMLTFPELRPEDFRPWVDPAEARRKAMDPDEYAANRADLWRNGLKSWDQDGARIQRLRDAAEVAIYTPGGTGGLPLTVLRSFDAPPDAVRDDAEALADRINAAVSGLLTLLDIDPDPVRSREHILLSTILHRSWTKGESLDLATLIQRIQRPGIERLGVLDLESFFPSSERFGLAMLVNNLLASPGFAAWTQGDPLDIDRLLYTAEGKPRLAVLSLGHLDDKERMFFVTTLLNELVTWMRSQSGTSSLRALLYMDEIFGYFPPTANPPSKRPMLTLLKQARAYGLGVVLCTQNPVDLDYKGLSNTGTWFIGRLQTERDKLRVLDGLEGASTAAGHRFDRGAMEALISGLDSRVFLLNNVHEDAPVLFHTRWALSYLSGPMTREQIRRLMDDHPVEAITTSTASGTIGTTRSVPRAAAPAPAPGPDDDLLPGPPTLPTSVEQTYVSARDQPQGTLVYRPALLGRVRLHYVRTSANVDHWDDLGLITTQLDAHDPWAEADALAPNALRMDASPRDGRFAPLPNGATKATHFKSFERALKEHAYRERPLTLLQAPALKEWAKPGEDERAFRIRLRDEVRDRRDLEVEKLRDRFGKKLKTLEDRKRRAEDKVEREKAQLKQSGLSTAVSVGATLLGALLGRKKLSVGNVSRAGTAVRGASRTVNERSDVARAEEALEVADERLLELSSELEQEIDEVKDRWDPETLEIESIVLRPRKGDLQIEALSVAWLPHERRGDDLVPLVDWDEA